MSTYRKIFIVLVMLALSVVFLCRIHSLQQSIARHERNYDALCEDLTRITDDYSHEVVHAQALELSKNEFERLYSEQTELVKALNLKVARLQTMVNTATVIRDTVYIRTEQPVIMDSATIVRPFRYHDDWLTLRGSVREQPDSTAEITLDYQVRDTVDVYVYRTPKKFLFIRYGTKCYDCYVRNRNPHATVTSMSCVVSTKKK